MGEVASPPSAADQHVPKSISTNRIVLVLVAVTFVLLQQVRNEQRILRLILGATSTSAATSITQQEPVSLSTSSSSSGNLHSNAPFAGQAAASTSNEQRKMNEQAFDTNASKDFLLTDGLLSKTDGTADKETVKLGVQQAVSDGASTADNLTATDDSAADFFALAKSQQESMAAATAVEKVDVQQAASEMVEATSTTESFENGLQQANPTSTGENKTRSKVKKGYDIEDNDPRPRNLQLAFIGDSVTRYQYISLVYFLKTGTWWNRDTHPTILYRGNFSNWNEYLRWSNEQLLPEEQCDCYRNAGRGYYEIKENRYFSDPARNNTVYYLLKYGKAKAHGHWTAPVDPGLALNQSLLPPYTWEGYNWDRLITEHIAKLDPKPEFVVFNAGLHPHRFYSPEQQQMILDAFNATNMVGIYKTTTRTRKLSRTSRFSRGKHDRAVCSPAVFSDCIDQSWTGDLLGPDFYYDDNHLKSAGNTLMNLQLLAYLREYRGGVTAIDKVDSARLLLDPISYGKSLIAAKE